MDDGSISYIAFESEQVRHEEREKRKDKIILILILILFLNNIAWLVNFCITLFRRLRSMRLSCLTHLFLATVATYTTRAIRGILFSRERPAIRAAISLHSIR